MVEFRKWMILLAPRNIVSPESAKITAWAKGLPAQLPSLEGLELEHVSLEDHRAHVLAFAGKITAPEWSTIVTIWTTSAACPHVTIPDSLIATYVKVREHRAFDLHGVLPAQQVTRGFKKTTFWKALGGLAPEVWQSRYRAHVPTVQICHPAWAYRQNVIEEKPSGFPYDAVSENWWATRADLCERFYLSEPARRTVVDETNTFIDKTAVATVVTRHRVVVSLMQG